MKQYRIVSHERLNNSRNGNPRFSLVLWDGESEEAITCTTSSDAGFVYGLDLRKGYIQAKLVERRGKQVMVNGSTK